MLSVSIEKLKELYLDCLIEAQEIDRQNIKEIALILFQLRLEGKLE